MAEAVVRLVQKNLAQLLKEQPFFLRGCEGEIKLLIDEFQQLERFLKFAEAKQSLDYRIRNWVSDVVRGAQDAEDLVETMVLLFEEDEFLLKTTWLLHDFADRLTSAAYLRSSHPVVPRSFGRKLLALKRKIHDIVVSLDTYGGVLDHTTPTYNDQHLPLREYRSRAFRGDAVGLETPIMKLVALLTRPDPPPPPASSLFTVGITGMGGIGKTTLAQCIYNHEEVTRRFQLRGWVSVSQNFSPKRVLLELVTQLITATITPHYHQRPLTDHLERLPVPMLKTMLYEHLQQRRYLVVLDDVWSNQAWDDLLGAFPDVGNGSRLVLTTRNNNVALHAGGYIHPMKVFLGGEESWSLFQKITFKFGSLDPGLPDRGKTAYIETSLDSACLVVDPELEEIGKHIFAKCRSLPLIIVGVGSYLSQRRLTREWQLIRSSMTPLGPQGRLDHLSAILALSYKDLAPDAKSCFLRLGFFPRDREIPTKKLFHIWMADGLVSEDQASGDNYLQELIDKNLVQVAKASIDGKPKTCHVHPSIHELSILKAKEEIFLEIHESSLLSRYNSSHPSSRTRHKVILSNSPDDQYFHPQKPAPGLRSLYFLSHDTPISKEKLDLMCEQFKLLRVLDLEGLLIEDRLPKGIGKKLRNLRYLNLRKTGIKRLCVSMRHLRRLLILDIRGNSVDYYSLDVVREMRNLRHVYLDKQSVMERGSERLKFDTLKQLQSIGWISQLDLLENKMEMLTLIRKLKLKILPSDAQMILVSTWRAMAALNQIESLHLMGTRNVVVTPEQFPPNVKKITLCKVNVSSTMMVKLAELPNLAFLGLKESSIEGGCLMLDANNGFFGQLMYLELSRLDDLEELSIQSSNRMSRLRCLRISQCSRLTSLPDGLEGVLEQR